MPSPQLVLTRHLAGRAARSAAPWGLGFGLVVYTSAATYEAAYPDPLQREVLARSLGANVGLAALFGPMRAIDTVGGFAAWRSLGLLTIIGAVWGVLAGARLLRGEEEAGRWEVVLGGSTTRRRAATAGVAAGAAAVACLWALTTAGALLAGLSTDLPVSAGAFLGLVDVLPAALFLALGLLAGQLLPTRRGAALAGAAAFGVAYLLRVVAIGTDRPWLRRATPLGWVDDTRPMTGSRAGPLLVLLALCAAAAAATVLLAGRRDLGTAPLGRERTRPGSLRLLSGVTAFAVRQALPPLAGWLAGLGAVCAVLGLVSGSVADSALHSGALRGVVDELGGTVLGARTFLGLAMITLVTAIALAGASSVTAIRESESAGQADTLLVQPVSRVRWLTGRAVSAALAVVVLGLAVGFVLWAATAGGSGAAPLRTMLAAGLNAAPVALFVVGLGVLVLGVAPRLTAVAVYGVVAWSFLAELVGVLVDAPRWVLDTSLLHHVALAPAVDPRWGADAVLVASGLVAGAAGIAAFTRRDLVGA